MGLVGFLKMSGIEVCHVLDSKSEHNGLHAVMGVVGFLKMSMLQHYLLTSISYHQGCSLCARASLESKSEHNGFHGVMGLVGFLKMSMLQHYLLASIS